MEYIFTYDCFGGFVAMYNILEDFEISKNNDNNRAQDRGFAVIVNNNESIRYFINNAPTIGTEV